MISLQVFPSQLHILDWMGTHKEGPPAGIALLKFQGTEGGGNRNKADKWTHLEDLLQERVESGEAVVGRCGAAEQQPHRVSLVAEGRLHSNEDLAELLAKYQQLVAVGVQLAWSSPIIVVRPFALLYFF